MIWKPRYCNCWVWSIYQYVRYGGHIAFRKTHYGKLRLLYWCHSFWSPDNGKTWLHYKPLYPKRRFIPPLFYKGIVTEGIS